MKLLASMLNAQAMHYDGSNNIINSRGFIPGGRDGWGGGGGASRGFDISHSLSRHSLTVTM